jgi:hypothetical protein
MRLDELREVLEIDLTSPTGLRWRVDRGTNPTAGLQAGSLNPRGYYEIRIYNKLYKSHRIIYALYHNLELDQLPRCLDHIDRNKVNSHPLNLRPVTQQQNVMNQSKRKDSTSGFTGVSWSKRHGKWETHVQINKKKKHLGLFSNLEDARKVSEEARIKHYGEFSRFSDSIDIAIQRAERQMLEDPITEESVLELGVGNNEI